MKLSSLKNWIKTWTIALIPPILFIILINWGYDLIMKYTRLAVKWITGRDIDTITLSNFFIGLIVVFLTLLIILFIWSLLNSKKYWAKIKHWIIPIVLKIPLLSSLFKIVTQISRSLDWESSFKKVVLVNFPTDDFYSVWFITSDNIKTFEKTIGTNDLVTVFIPTTPNPTSWFTLVMKKWKVKEIKMTVTEALWFLVSMGTAWWSNEIIKKTSE